MTARGSPEAAFLATGARVAGKYAVERVLGRGAMGIVYRAIHVDLHRPVALKVLKHLDTRDEVLIRRFRREAQTAARLDHPNTVRVLDFGEDPGGFLYLVMEYVDAEPLSKVLKASGPLAWDRVLRLWIQVAEALQAAHSAGVIHRDVKPSNVLLPSRRDGGESAKICDFGLAKFTIDHLDPEATQDPKWKAAGTPIYMAPEQALGDPLDGRADIYASGVMAFHLLEGHPPFRADGAARILMMHVSTAPPPLTNAPSAVQELVHACMAKDLDSRIADGRTLAERCRAILDGEGRSRPMPTAAAAVEDLVNRQAMLRSATPAAATASPERLEVSVEEDERPVNTASIEELVNLAVEEAAREATSDLSGEKDLRIEGLDTRRPGEAMAERAAYMYTHFGITYEPYEGSEPFWARDHRGELIGPMKRTDLWLVVQRSAERQAADRVLVSADRERWVTAHEFVRWVGQESLLDAMTGSLGSSASVTQGERLRGSLHQSSPIRALSQAARARATGRLVFERTAFQGEERLEVHLVNGRPTFVYSSDPALQIPELMVEKGLLPRARLDEAVHRCLREERSLQDIIAEDSGIDVGQWRNALMKQRLGRLLPWSDGRFLLDDQSLPSATRPFAESLLSASKELAYRTLPEEALRARVAPFLGHPPKPTEGLRAGLVELRLTQAQAQLLHRLFKARSLGEGLNAEARSGRMAATLLYVLVEAGLLFRPGS